MTARTSLPLIVIALILLGWIGVLEFGRRSNTDAPVPASLSGVDFEDAVALEWVRGEDRIRLELGSGGWSVVSPIEFSANEEAIELIFDAFAALGAPDTVDSEAQNPRLYGLEPASATARVEWSDGTTWRADFGSEIAGGEGLYTTIGDEPWIRQAGAELAQWVWARAEDWKSRRFLAFEINAVTSIEIENRVGQIRLVSAAGDASDWRVESPISAPAYGGQIRYWLGRLEQSPVRAFGSLEDFESSGIRAQLSSGQDALVEWEIGLASDASSPWVPVKRSAPGDVVYLDAEALRWLTREPSGFRDPRLFSFEPGEVRRLEATTADPFVLDVDPSGQWWVEDSLGRFAASSQRVLLSLQSLAFLEAARFIEAGESESGLANPQAVFRVYREASGGAPLALLRIGQGRPDGALYAATQDVDDVFLLQSGPLQPLTLSGFQYRDGVPFPWAASEVAGAWIKQGDRERGLRRFENGEWDVAPPFGGVAKRFSTEETLVRLTELTDVDWLDRGAGALERFGLSRDGFRIAFLMRSGAEVRLWLGGEAPDGGVYAATELEGTPWVFVVGPELADRLRVDFALE